MELSHVDENGAKMVDIDIKEPTNRMAICYGFVKAKPETIQMLKDKTTPKGDVLNTARIAGIQGAKQTSNLIPLCHNIPLSNVKIEFAIDDTTIHITSTVKAFAKTGVEMEALTAVSITALTIYDMLKAVDKSMGISNVKLIYKSGGKSGTYINGEKKGFVLSTNISEAKGTIKQPKESISLLPDYGIIGDSHAEYGSKRQISFLGTESIDKMKALGLNGLCFGVFAENITTQDIVLYSLPVGTKILIGQTLHIVTQIGKKCHAADGCEVARKVGTCVMPKEGIFTRVLSSGEIKANDPIYVIND